MLLFCLDSLHHCSLASPLVYISDYSGHRRGKQPSNRGVGGRAAEAAPERRRRQRWKRAKMRRASHNVHQTQWVANEVCVCATKLVPVRRGLHDALTAPERLLVPFKCLVHVHSGQNKVALSAGPSSWGSLRGLMKPPFAAAHVSFGAPPI
jgi:hypothetical protein